MLRSALARVSRLLVGRACAAAASALFCGRIEHAHVLAVLQHVEAVHLEHGEQGDGGAVELQCVVGSPGERRPIGGPRMALELTPLAVARARLASCEHEQALLSAPPAEACLSRLQRACRAGESGGEGGR